MSDVVKKTIDDCCCGDDGTSGGGCDLPTTLYFKTEFWSDVGGAGEQMCCSKTFPIYNTGTGDEINPIWLNQVPWTDNLCDYVCYALFQCYASGDYRLFVGGGCMGTGSWDGNYETHTGLDWGQPWGTSPLDLELLDWFSASYGTGALYGTYQPWCPFPVTPRMFVSETPPVSMLATSLRQPKAKNVMIPDHVRKQVRRNFRKAQKKQDCGCKKRKNLGLHPGKQDQR